MVGPTELTKEGDQTNDDADDHGDRVERSMEEIEVGGMLGLEDNPEEEEDETADAGDAVDREEQVLADDLHFASVPVGVDGGGSAATRAVGRLRRLRRLRLHFPLDRSLGRRRHRLRPRPRRQSAISSIAIA